MKTLALCAIIGNEEKTIERFLRSFAPIVDTFCLVFAPGNRQADSSLTIAMETGRALGKQIDVGFYTNDKDFPHVDHFGNARQQSWRLGERTGHDWLMWADCDDTLPDASAIGIRDALETAFEKDVLLVPYEVRAKKQIVLRERIVKNNDTSFWKHPIHEILVFNRDVSYRTLHQAPLVHSPLSDREPALVRNENILLAQVEDVARNYLHLHIGAFDTGNARMAQHWGLAALHAPGLESENRYEVLLNLAQLGTSREACRGYAAEAFELCPDRREALALLINYDLVDEDFYRAAKRAHLMMGIPKPNRSYWRLNHEWYDWKGLYLYANTLRQIEESEKANKAERKYLGHTPTFSIVHPTFKRPEQALAVRELWLSFADDPKNVEYIFGLHHDDPASWELLRGYRHELTNEEGCCPNTMTGLRVSTGKFVMVVADDLFPFPGWDTAVREKLDRIAKDAWDSADSFDPKDEIPWWKFESVLNFNDTLRTDGHMCHSWMTRPFMENIILSDPWPGTGIFSDNEFTHRARKAGVVIDAPELIFEHRHPSSGKAPMDVTYEDQNKLANYTEGLRLFKERNPDAGI